MINLDRDGVESILIQLEDMGLFETEPQYEFKKVGGRLCFLGAGGTSYVYEMTSKNAPDRSYALKVIGLSGREFDPDYVGGSVQIQHHLSEESENVMRVIDIWAMKICLDEKRDITDFIGIMSENYDMAEGIPVQMIIMEKLECIIEKDMFFNVSLLRDELKTEKGIIEFAKQIGRALFTIHNNSFLHRDVKLENIFWDRKENIYKLGDFGVAKYVGEGTAETVLFTDGYGAPEIERRLRESYDATADIYSFGITLYLLLNDLCFPGSESYSANIIQYEKDFVPPAPRNASEDMTAIVRRMISYRPEDRYQSVEEILIDIERLDATYVKDRFESVEEDILTETYREELRETTVVEKPLLAGNDDSYLLEKPESELTYEEKKRLERLEDKEYGSYVRFRLVITVLVVFVILKAFWGGSENISEWRFLILPAAVLAESVLQRINEFHITFGIVTIGIAVYSMILYGVSPFQILAIIYVFFGAPALTAGCALGMGLCILQTMTGKPEWLSFLQSPVAGSIGIICAVLTAISTANIMVDYDRA